jgi:hypothetical protein
MDLSTVLANRGAEEHSRRRFAVQLDCVLANAAGDRRAGDNAAGWAGNDIFTMSLTSFHHADAQLTWYNNCSASPHEPSTPP